MSASSSQTLIMFLTLFALLWVVRPRGGWSKSASPETTNKIIAKCEAEPNLIEYVELLDTYGGKVICELKIKGQEAIRVGTGVAAVEVWLKLKALKGN